MFFFFKHKTAYDVLISDWSSDVCSSDLWLYPSYGGWVRVGGGVCVAMWKRIAVYGLLLGLGTLALQWLDYQRMARLHMRGVYDLLLAAGFLEVGLWIGARVLGRRGAGPALEGRKRGW